MSKHTPGPWRLAQDHVDPEWHIVVAAGGRIIANVHIEAGNEMDAANARLVIASPDLLAAARAAREMIGHMTGAWPGTMSITAKRIDDMLRDSIAKAETL